MVLLPFNVTGIYLCFIMSCFLFFSLLSLFSFYLYVEYDFIHYAPDVTVSLRYLYFLYEKTFVVMLASGAILFPQPLTLVS